MNLMRRRRGWVVLIPRGARPRASRAGSWASPRARLRARASGRATPGGGRARQRRDDPIEGRPRQPPDPAARAGPRRVRHRPRQDLGLTCHRGRRTLRRSSPFAARASRSGAMCSSPSSRSMRSSGEPERADTESDPRLPPSRRPDAVRGGSARHRPPHRAGVEVPLGRQRVIPSSGAPGSRIGRGSSRSRSLHRDVGAGGPARATCFPAFGDVLFRLPGRAAWRRRSKIRRRVGGALVGGARRPVAERSFHRPQRGRPRAAPEAAPRVRPHGRLQPEQLPPVQSVVSNTYRLGGYDYLHGSADLMFKWRGLARLGEALLRNADLDSRDGKAADGKPLREWSRAPGPATSRNSAKC